MTSPSSLTVKVAMVPGYDAGGAVGAGTVVTTLLRVARVGDAGRGGSGRPGGAVIGPDLQGQRHGSRNRRDVEHGGCGRETAESAFLQHRGSAVPVLDMHEVLGGVRGDRPGQLDMGGRGVAAGQC